MKRAVVFKLAKGFTQRGKNNYRITANRVDHALMFAYRDRRVKKRVAREGFVAQINAATRQLGVPYSQFMDGVQRSNIALNRKMLAELAVTEPYSFQSLVSEVKKVNTIKWRDTHANRLSDKDYVKYDPAELPPAWKNLPVDTFAENNYAFAQKELETATKKAEALNAALIKSGKVAIKKHVPKVFKRPRANSAAPAASAAPKGKDTKA